MPPSSATAYQTLQDFQANRATPDSAVAAGQDKYGVTGIGSQLDALRTMTGNLQTSIKNVDPSVTGRTAGSLVTEAQRGAIVNNERAPLVDQYNATQNNANEVSHQYDEATGLASNYANSLLQGDENKYNELFGNYTTLAGREADAAKAAEAKREFDLQLADSQAARKAAASSGAGGISLGGLGGGGNGATTPTATPVTLNRNSAGGYAFAQGSTPATMGQYLVSKGYSGQSLLNAAAQLLNASNGQDRGISNAISSGHYTPAQLEKLFPQIFGGI